MATTSTAAIAAQERLITATRQMLTSANFHSVHEDEHIFAHVQHHAPLQPDGSRTKARLYLSGVDSTTGERIAVDVTITGKSTPKQAENANVLRRFGHLQYAQTGAMPAKVFVDFWEQVLASHLASK